MFSKAYVDGMAAQGLTLTPLGKHNGVDFDLTNVRYVFDASVDMADPELAWKAKHLSNIVFEWRATLVAVK